MPQQQPLKTQNLEPKTWVLMAMLVVFVALAIWAGTRNVLPGDVRVTKWVQELNWPLLNPLTDATNWSMSGIPLTMGGVIVVFILSAGNMVSAAVVAVTLGVRLVNGIFKSIIESPRPTSDLVAVSADSSGYGYPSGHVSGALLVVGALAWILTRREQRRRVRWLIWGVAGSWIVLTGIGRIRVGAHWPTDVLSGWLWALPVLVLIIRVAERVEESRRRGVELPQPAS